MATSIRHSLCQRWSFQVLFTQVRGKHKFKTHRARPKPMERRVFEEITQPLYPATAYVVKDSCMDLRIKKAQDNEENPYEQFLIKQLQKQITSSQTILICHRMPCSNFRLQTVRVALKEKGLTVSIVNNKHMKLITAGTHLANLDPMLQSKNLMLTSPDIVIKDAINVLKKTPELILLGGFLGDRLVTKDQMMEFSKLPPMEALLGQLCASLNQVGGGSTRSLLNSHQQTLATNLQQYHKQKCEEES